MTNQTLTLTKFWKVLTIACSIGLFLFLGYMLVFLFTQDKLPTLWSIFTGLLIAGMMGVSIYGILSALMEKIVFTDQHIQFVEVRKITTLDKSEITGYQVDSNYIYLITNKRRHKISVYYSGYIEVLAWLATNYIDLDQERYDAEEEEIMNDASFGMDANERTQSLAAARKRTKIYNIAATIIGLLILFYPKPYDVMLGGGIVAPLIGLLIAGTSKGLIKIDESTGKAYPSILSGFLVSAMAVCLRGFLDFDVLGYTAAIAPILVCTIFCGSALIVLDRNNRRTGNSLLQKIAYIIWGLMYSYGLVIHLNCYYDMSDSFAGTTEVLGKRETGGSDKNYYLEIDESLKGYDFDEFEVSAAKYQRTAIGDSVDINIYPGRLGISWVTVD